MDQTYFSAALLDPDLPAPAGLHTCNGSDPERRFAVYRNNVLHSLTDALAHTFPVTQALVGEEFFRAMAHIYVRANPPRSPILAYYGQGFADFVAGFAPAASLPYLPDVARLEMARVEVYHAVDEPGLTPQGLAQAVARHHGCTASLLQLTPAVQLLRSRHPVVSVWSAHQTDTVDLSAIDWNSAQAALICRNDELEVLVIPLDAEAAWSCFDEPSC